MSLNPSLILYIRENLCSSVAKYGDWSPPQKTRVKIVAVAPSHHVSHKHLWET
jgi:hypothetical protein